MRKRGRAIIWGSLVAAVLLVGLTFGLIEWRYARRVATVRALDPGCSTRQIRAELGEPEQQHPWVGLILDVASLEAWDYRGPLDWSRCLSRDWPPVRLPRRQHIVVVVNRDTQRLAGALLIGRKLTVIKPIRTQVDLEHLHDVTGTGTITIDVEDIQPAPPGLAP
jgi:hypothetical protein